MKTIFEVQKLIVEVRRARGFTDDPIKLLALLGEEAGEVCKAIKPFWSEFYGGFDIRELEGELADILIVIFAISNRFGIDVEDSLYKKIMELEKDGKASNFAGERD
jgi:NTP pyrophosphatase (non-canonical NTP hydrolase)